jgi:hypothetical protein
MRMRAANELVEARLQVGETVRVLAATPCARWSRRPGARVQRYRSP